MVCSSRHTFFVCAVYAEVVYAGAVYADVYTGAVYAGVVYADVYAGAVYAGVV